MATTLPRPAARQGVRERAEVATGPAAAAMIGGGIGTFILGLMVTGAEYFPALKTALTWDAGVGPLSGKTGVAVIAFFVSWIVSHYVLKDKNVDLKRYFTYTLVLIAIGFLLTFPPFFELFTRS